MKTKDYTTAIVILLALHLLFVNTDIIIKLLKALAGELNLLQKSGALLFALSYSLITVLIIKVYPRLWMFGLTAVFDGFAVYLNYGNKPYFTEAAAVYLGLYTTLIILATGFIERSQKQNRKETELNQSRKELIRRLTEERRSIQQSLRRLTDPDRRQERLNQLQQIENQLKQLQNQN